MNDTVSALILSQADFRESDVIVRVLTKEYGLLSFIAKGARKMTSKNAGSIIPVTKAEIQFDYKDGQTMFRLKTARTKKFYRRIHEDLKLTAASNMLCDVCAGMAHEAAVSDEEFDLLEHAFDLLQEGKDPDTLISLYISDMMKLFGIQADADECVRCGNTTVTALSAKDGGFLCHDCAAKAGVREIPAEDLKRFRLIVKGSLRHIDLIMNAAPADTGQLGVLIDMLRIHAGLQLRSFAFYKALYYKRYATIE